MVATHRLGPIREHDNAINSPFFRGLAITIKNSYSLHQTIPRLASTRMREPDIILAMDKPSVNYLADHLKSLPSLFIQTGGGPFIHPKLYQDGLPDTLQSILTLCNSYSQLGPSDHTLSVDICNASRTLLDLHPSLHNFKAELAFVQSLILLQIITLFTPSPPITPLLRQQADNRVPLLQASVEGLYRSTPATLPSSMPPYEAWVLAESCRRTMHVAHLVHGVYLMQTQGTFNLTMFVKALPLCRNVGLWELDPSVDNELGGNAGDQTGNVRALETELISYRELTDMWDNDEVQQLHLFEEMLIAACKGIDSVRERFLDFHTPPVNPKWPL
jgi:hypothetical protein